MSLLSSWGGKETRGNEEELSISKVSSMTLVEQSRALFESIRGKFNFEKYFIYVNIYLFIIYILDGDIPAIRNILQVNRSLLVDKIFGFEGHDIYGIIPNVK